MKKKPTKKTAIKKCSPDFAMQQAAAKLINDICSVQFSSVQFMMVSRRSGKLICAPTNVSKVSERIAFQTVE